MNYDQLYDVRFFYSQRAKNNNVNKKPVVKPSSSTITNNNNLHAIWAKSFSTTYLRIFK